ncbi:MAG: phage portal protein, partial [Mycobacteriaceae bacterium]
GRVLALERDAEGEVPTVGQFTPYDPSTFTKVIDMYAKIMSSITGLPPHVLGYTTDNPASADAIRSTEMRLKLKADRKTKMFGESWRDVMKLALLIRDGSVPDNADSITTVWADTATPTPAATTDAIFKQISAGAIPATSDVTLEKLGYTAVERQRLAIDRANDEGASLLQEIAHSLNAKALRVDTTVIKDAGNPAAVGSTPATAAKTTPTTPPSGNGAV